MSILITQTLKNQLHVANKFVSYLPMLNNSKVTLLFQMNDKTNLSFLKVFKQPRKGKEILELLEWMRRWWKLVIWNLQWPQWLQKQKLWILPHWRKWGEVWIEIWQLRWNWRPSKRQGLGRVIERPRGRNIVACKWVLHIKKDAAWKIESYKGHLELIAKGFTRVYNVDY